MGAGAATVGRLGWGVAGAAGSRLGAKGRPGFARVTARPALDAASAAGARDLRVLYVGVDVCPGELHTEKAAGEQLDAVLRNCAAAVLHRGRIGGGAAFGPAAHRHAGRSRRIYPCNDRPLSVAG